MNEKDPNKISQIILGTITSIISGIILTIITTLWEKFQLNLITLCIVLSVVIFIETSVIIGIQLWKRNSYKSTYYPFRKIQYKYEFKYREIFYKMVERVENNQTFYDLEFSRKVTVVATSNECDRISERYIWTGNSESSIPKAGKNVQDINQQVHQPGIWNYYDVIFRKLGKHKEIDLEYKWPTIQNCKSASPFVSTSTDTPTKELIFNIDLGKNYANKDLWLEEHRSIDGSNLLSTKDYQFDDEGKCIIKLHPKRFRHFQINWKW